MFPPDRCLQIGLIRTEEDDYVYDDVDVDGLKAKNNSGGARLVGARLGKMKEEVPFIVAINTHG